MPATGEHRMADPTEEELVQLAVAALQREPRPRPAHNYPDTPAGLLQVPQEESTWRLFSPKRRRDDIAAFDNRVLELHKRVEAVMAQAAAVREELRLAPERDADALAEAQLSGGKHPAPTAGPRSNATISSVSWQASMRPSPRWGPRRSTTWTATGRGSPRTLRSTPRMRAAAIASLSTNSNRPVPTCPTRAPQVCGRCCTPTNRTCSAFPGAALPATCASR